MHHRGGGGGGRGGGERKKGGVGGGMGRRVEFEEVRVRGERDHLPGGKKKKPELPLLIAQLGVFPGQRVSPA